MDLKQTIIERFRKGFKGKTNLFVISLYLIAITAVLFSLTALLNVQSSTNHSFLLNNYSISFNIDLFNKEAKKVFKMEEYATSKKSVPLINGVPIMTSEKVLPLCENATERLLEDLKKELPKLVKKVDKKF